MAIQDCWRFLQPCSSAFLCSSRKCFKTFSLLLLFLESGFSIFFSPSHLFILSCFLCQLSPWPFVSTMCLITFQNALICLFVCLSLKRLEVSRLDISARSWKALLVWVHPVPSVCKHRKKVRWNNYPQNASQCPFCAPSQLVWPTAPLCSHYMSWRSCPR